jgi:hypothetical protein
MSIRSSVDARIFVVQWSRIAESVRKVVVMVRVYVLAVSLSGPERSFTARLATTSRPSRGRNFVGAAAHGRAAGVLYSAWPARK